MHDMTFNAPDGLSPEDQAKLQALRERVRTQATLRKARERIEAQRKQAEALRRAGRNPTPWRELPVWRKLLTVAGLAFALASLGYGVIHDLFGQSLLVAMGGIVVASIGRSFGEFAPRCQCCNDDPFGHGLSDPDFSLAKDYWPPYDDWD